MDKNIQATGSCNCGTVQYSVSQPLKSVVVCHCSICRKATGSNGIAVTVVPKSSLSFNAGKAAIVQWRKPGHDWLNDFCQHCGSPVPAENDGKHCFIPVGTLDTGHEELAVKHHIFVDSKAAWDIIADGGLQHDGHISG